MDDVWASLCDGLVAVVLVVAVVMRVQAVVAIRLVAVEARLVVVHVVATDDDDEDADDERERGLDVCLVPMLGGPAAACKCCRGVRCGEPPTILWPGTTRGPQPSPVQHTHRTLHQFT